jgi:predicted transcriptional regulator
MRDDRPIYSTQLSCRVTNDLCNRIDTIAESKMLSRGGWMRNAILEKVREVENQFRSQQHQHQHETG